MREPYGSIVQGSASALLFGAFAVTAGVLVGWPASDILTAAIVACCGGFALEHFLRRHYMVAGIFIAGGLALVFSSMRARVDLGSAIGSAVGTEAGYSGPTGTASGSSERRGSDQAERRRAREEKAGAPAARAQAADTIPTTVEIHNPASVGVSVTYDYPGGSLPLGSVGPGGTAIFEIPLPTILELGTFTARAGDRTVRTRAWLRPRRAHQVELPSIDN